MVEGRGVGKKGRLREIVKEVEECDLMGSYSGLGKWKKDMMYEVIDGLWVFYLKLMDNKGGLVEKYWAKMERSGEYE